MARSLSFTINDANFDAEIIKVDRSHLYGTVVIETADMEGKRCNVATLAVDGKTLIPKGGTALGYINPEGEWVTRDQLQPVDLDGEPVEEVESSFDAPITLDKKVDIEVFLDHSVRLVYRLNPETEFPAPLLEQLKSGTLYQFGFSYRGGVGYDPAFILSDEEDNVWMMVTRENLVESVGLGQAAVCYGENLDEDSEETESTTIDFGML